MSSLSARRAWIEIREQFKYVVQCRKSLSARRAWIEIYDGLIASANFCVALRKESVDRNNTEPASFRACIVALRKESVDRNGLGARVSETLSRSLSARRAWIEITT